MSKQVIFDKKNVIIAGGAGFIGFHLCNELIKTCKVICIDNFLTGSEKNIDHLLANPDFVFINHDLSEPLNLEAIPELGKFKIEFQGIQEIYNLACPMSPRNFLDNRIANIQANSYVIKNLLDWAVKYNRKFLQFSSSVVYGPRDVNQPDIKLKESDLGRVDHLSERGSYDEGKRFAETIVKNYRSIYNIDAKIIRLFRIYGPRMQSDDDQMIPDFINNALENKEITIPGDVNFSSSFCYIEDLLDAVAKIMSTDIAGPINVGSDVDIKLSSLGDIIIKQTNSTSTIRYVESPLFVSELALPDIRRAKEELSWMPVVTLENGLKKTIFDIQAHKRLHGLQA